MSESERDEQQQEERPTPATRGRGGRPRLAAGKRKPKAPRQPTGRPRGRPTKGLLKVACPTCFAGIGFSCVTSTGKKLAAGHEKRRELAGLKPRKKWKGGESEGETP